MCEYVISAPSKSEYLRNAIHCLSKTSVIDSYHMVKLPVSLLYPVCGTGKTLCVHLSRRPASLDPPRLLPGPSIHGQEEGALCSGVVFAITVIRKTAKPAISGGFIHVFCPFFRKALLMQSSNTWQSSGMLGTCSEELVKNTHI